MYGQCAQYCVSVLLTVAAEADDAEADTGAPLE
jgi:hypothetical protein